MASRALTSARTSRTSLDQERENFERTQTVAIVKAVSETEAPLKAKHVRSAIIGTFQEKSSQTFWSIIMRLPLQSSPILAWKFCHALHKLLREGHPNVLPDSIRHRDLLVDTGRMWSHLKEGYGKLIYLYCRLLVIKLDFHRKNPRFPGNMAMTDEELEAVCENDINNYFQLSVELFDYMDEILTLQAAVFGSLDMSRSNSMTNAGQCRLSPLIPCIQDSSHIYDFVVKLLFRLHNSLPSDTLVGHRDRFVKQYRALKQFYLQSSTLQYFKSLITVPRLEDNPPNFLISSELSRHVTPVVIVPSEPPQTEGTLVTFDAESSVDGSERNGSISPDLLVERDRYIEHLLHQIEQMTAEMNRIRAESQRQVDSLRQTILDLELRLAEKDSELQEAIQGREDIERKLSEAAKSAQLGSVVQLQLQEAEKRGKNMEDKFAKLKEVYQKLRDEHIALLRQKAETDKKLGVTSSALEQSNKLNTELQESLDQAKSTAKEASEELQVLKSSQDDKVQVLVTEKEELATLKEQLQSKCLDVEQQVKSLETQLTELRLERENLSKDKNQTAEELTAAQVALNQVQAAKTDLEKSLEQSKNIIEGMTTELATLKRSQDEKVQELSNQKDEMVATNQQLRQSLGQIEQGKADVDRQLQELQTVFQNLQQEKAEIDQQFAETKQILEQSRQTVAELQLSLQAAESNVRQVTDDLQDTRKQNDEAAQRFAEEKVQWEDVTHRLKETLQGVEQQVKQLDGQISDLQKEKEELIRQSGESDVQHQTALKTHQDETVKLLQALLVECSVKAEQFMHKSVQDLSKGPAGTLTVQDQEELSTQGALSQVDGFAQALHVHCSRRGGEDESKATSRVIPLIFPLAQSVGLSLLQGQQLAHTLSNIEKADHVLSKCADCGKAAAGFFERLQNPQLNDADVDTHAEKVRVTLRALDSLIIDVMSELKGVPADDQDLEKELALMEQAIEDAAQRIAQLWDRSKQSHSGVKLEVNGKILDSCTSLMAAIIQLIKKAKVLQEEIVARGKGSASAKEFYKRNHHWTEGLLSAAKAVGFGAKLLTDAADKVVQGQAKFEQLTVASQEISASTAQLVFASRVKAERGSKNLQALTDASKAVSSATGTVVAAAKHCAELVEESNVLDFGHLSLHQAKRLEMESQVKVLELESSLEKERLRLAALRRQHYQLAGESAPDS